MKIVCFLLAPWMLFSCAKHDASLQVRQYHLRKSMFEENTDPMVRGEIQRRLHGAVTIEERLQKVGQYYNIKWNRGSHAVDAPEIPVRIVFEYQQAGTASLVKKMIRDLHCSEQCEVEFAIKGADYAKNGRILTWRVTVLVEGAVVSEKHSYMWR